MPIQSLVSEAPLAKVTKLAEGGHEGARQLATSFVGQGLGLIDSIQVTRTVVREFMEDYLGAVERMNETLSEEYSVAPASHSSDPVRPQWRYLRGSRLAFFDTPQLS